MPRKTPSVLLVFSLCMCASCAWTPFAREAPETPDEKIAALAGQIEEVVLNTRLDQPEIEDFEVDSQTGEVLSDVEPMNLIIDIEEIRRKVPALAELNADNEVMLAAIRGRILRRPAVYELEQEGCVGENREGLLVNLASAACSKDRSARDRTAYVVWLENRDRRAICEQLVKSAGLGKGAIPRVRELFAEQIHRKAWAGTPLQMPDGEWERKRP